jgi:uncharacterized membrane protein
MVKVKYWIIFFVVVGIALTSIAASMSDNTLKSYLITCMSYLGGAFIGVSAVMITFTKVNILKYTDKLHWWSLRKENNGEVK